MLHLSSRKWVSAKLEPKEKGAYIMNLTPLGANQTEIKVGDTLVLFSYKTPVAAYFAGAFYKTSHFWSVTTSKHINKWLDGAKVEEMPQEWFDKLFAEVK
jgi:hypothetical protein